MRICSIEGCSNVHLARGWCRMHYLRWRKYGNPLFTIRWQPVETRFWRLVDKGDGCWLWLGHVGPAGYGTFRFDGDTDLSHRIAYRLLVGEIPGGHHLDHLCRIRRCVNPRHLEPVLPAENNRRSESPSALNARKTHCVHGHEFSLDNTARVRGMRVCRTCRAERLQRYRAERRSA